MKRARQIFVVFAVLLAMTVGIGSAQACSPVPKSLMQHYEEHAKVFLGTVEGAGAQPDTYNLRVQEWFKGGKNEAAALAKGVIVPVAFGAPNMMCGFGTPKVGQQVLVFMNEGDTLNVTSGSFPVWAEKDSAGPNLNPVMDSIITLRRMTWGAMNGGILQIAPDEATALHLALQAMLPVFGKDAVTKNWPFHVALNSDKEGRGVWAVQGTAPCAKQEAKCRAGVLSAEIDRMTGDVVRVSSGD